MYRLPGEDEEQHPIPLTQPYMIALVILVIGVIVLGTVFGPFYNWSDAGALNLF
jgi:hypothetical protein